MTSPATPKSWRDVIKIHPAADLFPLMDADELKVVGEDIKKNGLHEPVVLFREEGGGGIYRETERFLLDGRNRLDAMEAVGLTTVKDGRLWLMDRPDGGYVVKYRFWKSAVTGFDPDAYVISANIHRRHLTAEQKRELIANVLKAQPQKSNRQIAEQTKSNHHTVGAVRTELQSTGTIAQLEKTTGKDNKARKQPPSKPAPDVPKPAEHRPVPGVACHPHADRGDDLYETPACAIRALLKAEQINGPIWEPACGPGAIVTMLRAAGHCVIATDLVDRGCPNSTGGVNFLEQQRAPDDDDVELVLTNPPYRHANKFVRHALTLAPRVMMLLPLRFLEGVRRSDILDNGTLARVHVFKNRLPMMHRAGWQGRRASSQLAFAWLVWDQAHRGPATLHRISWAPADDAEPAASPPSPDEQATPVRAAHATRTQRAAKPPRPPTPALVKRIADRAQARANASGAAQPQPPAPPSAPADDAAGIPGFLDRRAS